MTGAPSQPAVRQSPGLGGNHLHALLLFVPSYLHTHPQYLLQTLLLASFDLQFAVDVSSPTLYRPSRLDRSFVQSNQARAPATPPPRRRHVVTTPKWLVLGHVRLPLGRVRLNGLDFYCCSRDSPLLLNSLIARACWSIFLFSRRSSPAVPHRLSVNLCGLTL